MVYNITHVIDKLIKNIYLKILEYSLRSKFSIASGATTTDVLCHGVF